MPTSIWLLSEMGDSQQNQVLLERATGMFSFYLSKCITGTAARREGFSVVR